MVVPSNRTIALEGTASSIGVLGVCFEAAYVSGTEISRGSERRTTSAGGVKESGVSIYTHLEEVLESDDGLLVGVDVSGCWGDD